MLLVFEATVYRHQAHHYRQLQRSPPVIPALFPGATRDTSDQGLISCFKYLLNYTFYKFGLEVVKKRISYCTNLGFGSEYISDSCAFCRESFLLYTVIFVLFYSKEDKLNIAFQRISVVFSLNF